MSKDLLNPEEGTKLSPEALTIVNNYLMTNDISATSNALGIPREKVIQYLNKREAKRYIDTVFLEQGYLNRGKIADAMSRIIDKKLEELEEAEMGSNKDIADLLQMMQKFRHDEIKLMQADEKNNAPTVTNQTNVQNNFSNEMGTNYNTLLEKLVGETK
jgi:hypothetical protein